MSGQWSMGVAKGLELSMIAPSHGVIWTEHIPMILETYDYFASPELEEEACVVYDSMWHSTEKMALAVLEGFSKAGIPARLFDLKSNHISDVMTEVLKSAYVAVGSPTLNNQMLPTVASFLCYMKGLAPKNRKAFAFGSYGWGGQSIALVNQELESMGCQIIHEPIRQQYIPSQEQLREIEDSVAALFQ